MTSSHEHLVGKCVNISSIGATNARKLLKPFDNYIFDCDGVVWIGREAVPGSIKVLNRLRELGKRVFLVTNNSGYTREMLAQKSCDLGFEISKDDILAPAHMAATYLKDRGFRRKVYIVGRQAIADELDRVGISHNKVGPDPLVSMAQLSRTTTVDADVGCVIVGMDEHISYPKVALAATYLQDPQCIFIGTNPDQITPTNSSLVLPGCGAILAAVEAAARRKAIVMGKPEQHMCQVIREAFKLDSARTIMIGDNCTTDIVLGKRCCFSSLLVLSGVTDLAELQRLQARSQGESTDREQVPDFYASTVADIFDYLSEE